MTQEPDSNFTWLSSLNLEIISDRLLSDV